MATTKQLQKMVRDYIADNHIFQKTFAEYLGVSHQCLSHFLTRSKACNDVDNKIITFFNTRGIAIPDEPQAKVEHRDRPLEKIILETPEEIVEELLAGNTIYVENCNHYFKLQNGFIVRYNECSIISVNSPIMMDEYYYVMKPKQVVLKVGKTYLSYEGKECFIFAEKEGDFLGAFIGTGDVVTFNKKGEASYLNDSLYMEV